MPHAPNPTSTCPESSPVQGPVRTGQPLAQPHRGGRRPGVLAGSTHPPPPPRSPRPPASNSCCPALGHTPPGDAAHALLAQNPQQLPPPRRAGPPSGPVLPTQMGLQHEAAAAAQAHEPRGRPHAAIPAACPDGRRAAPAPRPSQGGRSQAVARPYHGRDPVTDREPRGKSAPPGPAHGTLRRRRTAGPWGGGSARGRRWRGTRSPAAPLGSSATRRASTHTAAACGVPHGPSPPAPPSSLHRSRDAVSERRPAPPMAQLCLPQGLAAGPRLPHTGGQLPQDRGLSARSLLSPAPSTGHNSSQRNLAPTTVLAPSAPHRSPSALAGQAGPHLWLL